MEIKVMVVMMMTVMMIDAPLPLPACRLPEDSEQCESLIPLNTISPSDGGFR